MIGEQLKLSEVFLSVEKVREVGGKPFVTETTGLGLAKLRGYCLRKTEDCGGNGYTQQTLNGPIIIADGLLGLDFVEVPIKAKHLDKVCVVKAIAECDAVICCTHFKLHMQAGIGGSIKNVGVDCVAKPSKFDIHISGYPKINDNCTECDKCVKICPTNAIENYKIV